MGIFRAKTKIAASLRLVVVGSLISAFAVLLLTSTPARAAAEFTIANCFRPTIGSTPLNASSYNSLLRNAVGNDSISVSVSYTNHHPNGITVPGRDKPVYDLLYINSVMVNGESVELEQITHTENTYMNESCTAFTWYSDNDTSAAYKLRNANGTESGYALKRDCGNLLKYKPTDEGWKSNGETEIFSQAVGWTKAHSRSNPLRKRRDEEVRWRHKVNITDRAGGAEAKFKVTTISTKNEAVVQLGGTGANYTNYELTVPAAQTSTGWKERNWTVPSDANPGDIYCQYWEWTPNEAGGTGKANSKENKEQCIEVWVDDSDWSLKGTTKLNGGTTDIQVEPDTCVTWTHTLNKVGVAAITGTISFRQTRTEGDSYSNADCGGQSGSLKNGTLTGTPATAVNNFDVLSGSPQVKTFSIKVPEGKTYCQSLNWTVSPDTTKNGQTARLCASTLSTGSSTEYVSRLRACAVKKRSLSGNTVDDCTPWVMPNNSPQSLETFFAKTKDEIKFRYEVDKIAQYQSRQRANYVPLAAFDQSKTLCSTNPDQAKDCIAKTPTTYRPPTTAGGSGTLNPGYLSPAMEPWYRAADNCALAGPSRALSGLAPTNCTSTESELASRSNFTYEGSGHTVKNADLGLTKSDLTQKISLSDVRIVVHKNTDAHTYTYDYKKKHTATCSSDQWNYRCSTCGTAPNTYSCNCGYRSSCSSYPVEWFGAGSMSGTSCRNGCTGVDGAADAVGSYDNNEHTWIEVMPDGPISAEVSFAIPYNYDITPQLNFLPDNAQRIQIGGTELAYSASFTVSPRFNSEVGETYATATRPGTQWRVIEFYLPASTPNPNWSNNMTANSTAPLSCTAFSGSAYDCNYTGSTGSLNTQSESNGFNLQNGSSFSTGVVQRRIQDAPIGTKYCVASAVMDSSSHNGASGYVSGNGYTDTMRGEWKMTKPECVSIGKMPMTNIIADGLYSDGKIEGATFRKQPSGQSNPGAFGSWGEYEVVSNSSVKNFASGAALGVGAGGVPLGGSTAYSMVSENLQNGSCQIAPLTFANANCSTTSITTELGKMSGANTSNGLARNIRHRYTGRSDAKIVSGTISPNNYNTCTGAQVVVRDSAGNVKSCAHYVKANGNLTISAGQLNPGRSLIVEASGTVTISGSITLNNGPYTDISQIPQIMIFANAINIDPATSQVDAWLLAGLNGGSGTINTCSSVNSILSLNGNTCTNRLLISGPVIANKVLLHRTNGAGIGMPASAQAAEIFYLSPATYLWAYNQSANLSQAYLTYAREVAPRF